VGLPKNAELFLPKQAGVTTGWVLPPGQGKVLEASTFDVDPTGGLWLGYGGRSLVNPLSLVAFSIDEKFRDMVYLDNGLLLMTNKKSLGYLVGVRVKGAKTRVLRSVFKPILELPAPDSRLFPGGKDGFYLIGRDLGAKRDDVFFVDFKDKRGSVRKVLTSPSEIRAVAGDGQSTWVVMDRAVFRIDRYQQAPQPVFAHLSEPIQDLISVPSVGFFYTTAGGVWFFHDGQQVPVLRGGHLKIRYRDDALFVLFPQGQGLLKITGASHYKALVAKGKR
jgi:hypothetical protein